MFISELYNIGRMFVICTKKINLFGSLYRVRYRCNLKVVLLFTRCFASSGTIEDIKYILPCFPTVSLSLNQDLCIKKAQTSLRCVLGDILFLKCNSFKKHYTYCAPCMAVSVWRRCKPSSSERKFVVFSSAAFIPLH